MSLRGEETLYRGIDKGLGLQLISAKKEVHDS